MKMDPMPASFYGKIDKKNPVISTFDGDINEFKSYMKRKNDSTNFDHNSYARGSKNLFEIWNKYKPRLPTNYYEEHLLQIADFLFGIKSYRLAIWQGYGRYMEQFCTLSIEDIRDADHFTSCFFPEGFDTGQAKLMFRALQGRYLCAFRLERERGEQPDQDGVRRLLGIVGFVRIMMQAVLPRESLCWLLYNGSLHIYDICKYLMSAGRSAQALEYLLWACVCLETSIPLLTVRFLSWRATLYCAACQCYYDGQAGVQAEVFARRALGKVSELGKLVEMSGAPASTETQGAFKEATVKLAAMVFKRSAYEPRRKPKGLFRPKQRSNLREIQSMPWPRTPTERVLMELFEGNAAQFLAVTEALWDSTRRPLQTGTPEEPEIQEVALELLSAGISLLSGVGGSSERVRNDVLPQSMNSVTTSSTLLEMATVGENTISVDAAVKFVKLLFRYEQWDMFCLLTDALLTILPNVDGDDFRRAELELTLLEAMERLTSTHKIKLNNRDAGADPLPERDKQLGVTDMSEELMAMVETLHACVCGSAQDIRPDRDLVMDILLFLWANCKAVFQRAQRHLDPARLGKMENQDKWVQTLFMLSEVAHACDLAATDVVVVAEMTLRLAMVLESNADSSITSGRKTATTENGSLDSTPVNKLTATPSLFQRSASEQLQTVWDVVERGVEGVTRGRTRRLPIADPVFTQKFGGAGERSPGAGEPESPKSPSSALLAMDLHLELLAFQHRVALKLLTTCPDELQSGDGKKSLIHSSGAESPEAVSSRARAESVLLEKIRKNKISKALFLVQKAVLSYRKDQSSRATQKLLEEAVALIEKAEVEERRLLSSCAPPERRSGDEERSRPPPAPILLSRTSTSIAFTPAPYALEEQVCWYQVYGREAEGINLKVRLGDCHLLGTGDVVPARGERVLRVGGLEPNQMYVFAVAAYDAQGRMVGSAIGESTRSLLASLPLPLLTAWTHLAQAAYQTGQYALAKRACNELWGHFTLSSPSKPGALQEPGATSGPEGLAQTRLQMETLQLSSPLLLQLFLSSIFMQTEIHVQEGALYCDTLSEGGPLIWRQEARLAECERMLLAIDLALWLNDSSAALQAVVGCYGLLAPLVYHQILSEAVVQVLMKCLMVLLEIPAVLKQKRPAATAESIQHMVACMTYYVAKGLRSFKEYRMASVVIEQGRNLLQDISEAPQGPSKPLTVEQDGAERPKKAADGREDEPSEQLKALEGSIMKNRKAEAFLHHDMSTWNRGANVHELTGQEDPILLYTAIGNNPLKNAFKDVMKFKRKPCFMEFAVLLLQRAMQEDKLEHLLQWGQDIFGWLKRRDEGMPGLKKGQGPSGKELKKHTSSMIEYNNKKQKISTFWTDKKRKEFLQKKQLMALNAQNTERECKAVDTLTNQLGLLLQRHQRRRRLRQVCSEESLWRCHLNLSLAGAHLGLLHRSLEHRRGPALQPWHTAGPPARDAHVFSYSQMPSCFFSLAHAGTLVRWSNVRPPELTPLPPPKATPQPHLRAYPRAVERQANESGQGAASGEESSSAAESEAESEADTPRTQQSHESECNEQGLAVTSPTRRTASQLLDTLGKAALHIRRAMVLAHRGGHWTSLQWACRVLWDQSSAIGLLVERGQGMEPPCPLTAEQLYTVLTPLLALATDLLMDMMQRLQLWAVYEEEEEELGSSLRCSGPLDDGTLVDHRWLLALALRTLELLYCQAKWETLAHLALLLNSHTRERYTHMITPLLVHAQRRLLDRIRFFEGPPVPQPHFTRTGAVSGEPITCRNYVGRQLLSGWKPSEEIGRSSNMEAEPLELAEVKRAMCVVRVPLDVEDTLRCFRESLERGRHSLLTFQHSRTLLLLLLAHTQPTAEVPFCKESGGQSEGRVEFSAAVSSAPGVGPPDLTREDFSSLGSVYGCPLPPSQLQTVVSSYSSCIKYLEANNHSSLRVQALHDLGNLHFYNGNRRAAHSHWSKALDCALQTSGVLESWDGVSWGGRSPQQTLQHAGIWGCLQAAVLSAKIAQHILTSNISQRTKCCLLSAQLFKCLLRASLPHPQTDLQYSSYAVEAELVPGLELFSQPRRGDLGGTVSSLAFLCHWLYSAGHSLTALPMLALYLYFVGTVCRDLHLTVGGRILKVRALTELGLFGQAVKEMARLTHGEEVPQPHGCYSRVDKHATNRKFYDHESLMDTANLQALEDLVNRRPSGDVPALYGGGLSRRLSAARVQLLLALCATVHGLPAPLAPAPDAADVPIRGGAMRRSSSTPGLPNTPAGDKDEGPGSAPARRAREPKRLQLDPQKDRLTLCKVKALLLREASGMLSPQLSIQLPVTEPEELELAVEIRLLLSAVSLQQGKTAFSAALAVSTLRLLQDSPIFQDGGPTPPPAPRPPSSVLRRSRAKREQAAPREAEPAAGPQPGDVPHGVEARERVGPALWLRCRLAAVRSLVAHIPGTAILPGVDSSVQAARLLKEGLQESEAWGDPDTRALLLLQGLTLDAHRGRPREDGTSLLQEAVSLLSGRSCLSLGSGLTLATATLLLNDLRGTDSQALHLLTQKLLQQQLSALGESVVLGEGGRVLLPPAPGLRNIYHPHLPLLAKTTMRLGHCLALQASAGQREAEPEPWRPWVCARDVLQSALTLSQTSATRDRQLEADILYCQGMVERHLIPLREGQPHAVAATLLESIKVTMAHSHNLQLLRRCYLEMALVYLQQWEQSSPAPLEQHSPSPPPAKPAKKPDWKRVRTTLNRGLTDGETNLLLFWVCVRAATKISEASASCAQLCGTAGSTGEHLPIISLKALPDFASNDLLNPCGGTDPSDQLCPSPTPDVDLGLSSRIRSQLTWVHLSRYCAHLFNLLHIATRPAVPQCVEGLLSMAADSTLALRLAQLQTFFSSHLLSYREQCVAPEPPTHLIQQPQFIQLSPTVRSSLCQSKQPVAELYPWACTDQQQLCMQWHRPALEPAEQDHGTILLFFGLNSVPLSAMCPTASAVAQLQAGQHLVRLDRLKAVHAQLCSVCVEAHVASSPAAASGPSSPRQERQRRSKTPDKGPASNPHQQMMLEKTRRCCAAIRDLLQPNSESAAVTEGAFEPSLQSLCELERCFNPAGGATVDGKALIAWLLPLLL